MTREEAAEIIKVLAQNLRNDPSQFNYKIEINFTGVSAQASAPGAVGINAVAVAADGGTATGFRSSSTLTAGDVEISRVAAEEEFRESIISAADLLTEVAEEVRSGRNIKRKLAALAGSILPAAILETVTALLKQAGVPC